MKETVESSAIIMFLIGMGYGIGYVLTLARIPHKLTEALLGVKNDFCSYYYK